ncbi:MAG: cytochrome c maturation protein CcmE [Deltaproteobacteria bacterium]|nr:cytochrome c maturation protein CcmE [Deltaproteobacteria bacterium]
MQKKNCRNLYVAALSLFILGAAYLVFSGLTGGSRYFIEVAEALTLPADKAQPVRLFGKVKPEGLGPLEEGVGVHFLLADQNDADKSLRVTFKGSVPDAFAPGAEVIVEGLYLGGGDSLTAKKLMTQCPSKYRKKES